MTDRTFEKIDTYAEAGPLIDELFKFRLIVLRDMRTMGRNVMGPGDFDLETVETAVFLEGSSDDWFVFQGLQTMIHRIDFLLEVICE